MSDPKVAGIRISKPTLCKVGTHSWVWTGSARVFSLKQEPGATASCDCGLYTWAEWQAVQEVGR